MLLEAANLRKTYSSARGLVAAVDGIDLQVPQGEFLAICGRSGSGKSTLLAMLGGLCRPSTGQVAFEGSDLWARTPAGLADLRARRIGFMFQFAGLLPNLRAADNVALAALLGGADYELAYARATELLARLELDGRWEAYPAELSGGEQRRVALARALVNRPRMLLADEPTNDLDERDEQEVIRLLRELCQVEETTLIVVTHNTRLAGLADRVVTLQSGRLTSESRRDAGAVAGNGIAPVPALEGHPPGAEKHVSLCDDASHENSPLSPGGRGAGGEGALRETGERRKERVERPLEDSGRVTSDRVLLSTFSNQLSREAPSARREQLGAGLGGFLVGFVGWVLLGAGLLFAIDQVAARLQRGAVAAKLAERRKSQDLALQQLRADLEDIRYEPDGGYEVSLFLENFEPEKPFHVLGPAVRVFVQVDRTWQEVSVTKREFSDRAVHAISRRESFRFNIRADLAVFDELLQGYMHVRITSTMLVSEKPDSADDVFERTDDYYAYLKPEQIPEAEVRRRNGWNEGALVPRWIGMPAH